ncbi:MAG: hypothetical protein QXT34_00160 [Candidatus Aenigmatarchaeota archaeon]
MIVDSIRFGFQNIFNKNVLVFALLLSFPFIFLITFSSLLFKNFSIIGLVTVVIFSIFYSTFVHGCLILSSFEIIKKNKEINYKEIVRGMLPLYPGFLLITLLINFIFGLSFLPFFVLSFVLVASLDKLLIWFISFLFCLFIGFYILYRMIPSLYIYLIDKKGIIQSIKTSWKISNGHVLRLFLINVVGAIILSAIGALTMFFSIVVFKNAILSSLIFLIFQVLIWIYQVFSISFAYNRFLRKPLKKKNK